MREGPEVVEEPGVREETGRKRIDLSVPQVAGSAVAAVVAARLASGFGVYGTILGAGLVSVIATCGGSVFQHFFTRTGRRLREIKATARSGRAVASRPQAGPDARSPYGSGEFTAGTVHRARARAGSRKRPVLAAALVFGVTMAGITTYELVSGDGPGGGRGTTVGNALSGHDTSSSDPGDGSPSSPSPSNPSPSSGSPDSPASRDASPTPGPSGSGTPSGGAASPGETSDSAPDSTPGTGRSPEPGDAVTPSAEPSAAATPPAPSADSRSGTAGPDRADPAER